MLENESPTSEGQTFMSNKAECPLIQDVISHLCKYLGTKAIKKCRLVSQSWNYGATPVLKARTVITLRIDKDYYKKSAILKIVEKLKFNPINICIVFNDDLPRDIETLDFTHVPLITNVKSIFIQSELEAELSSGSLKDFCENIILTSSATLENLEFLWDQCVPYFPALRGTVFPKMKKFEVLYNLSDEIDDEVIEEIGHTITECFPSLEYLNCAKLEKIARPGILSTFPTSLNSLILNGNFDVAGIECLLEIPCSLKQLTFGDYEGGGLTIETHGGRLDELPTIFYNLLKKHAQTLEGFETYANFSNRRGQEEISFAWKFPIFPAMTNIEIDATIFNQVEFETSPGHFGGIDYHICFPVLESLTVWSNRTQLNGGITFLPEENDQVVESVKDVELVFFKDGISMTAEEKLKAVGHHVRCLELFPSAKDSIIQKLKYHVSH